MAKRTVLNTQIMCNINNALSPRMVDCKQRTSWVSGVTTAPKISMLMDSDYKIGAVAFGNCRNVATESIVLSYGATIGAETTAVATITAPSDQDWLYETGIAAPATGPGWVARFATTVPTDMSIGTISLLDANKVIEFSSAESPDFPIGQPMSPGYNPLPLAGGDVVRQVVSGSFRKWFLNFGLVEMGINETYVAIQRSWYEYNGWANGVWLTTDEFDNATDQRAYYCVPAPGTDANMGVSVAGPWGSMTLELHEMPKGPQ